MASAGNKLKSDPVKVMLTICVGFLVIYLATDMKWALIVSLVVGLVGMFSTFLSRQVEFVWMKLTWLLSQIVPNILLSIVFFIFLFPIAVLSRIFGKKDPLRLKNKGDSLYRDSNKEFDKASFENPW